MPWILCGDGLSGSPARVCEITGLAAGSTATERIFLLAVVLDVARHAGDGAAGADAGDEDVDLAVGVVPDLGAGGALVDRRVGRVLELLRASGSAPGRTATISSALAIAPVMPSAPGVSTRLAPNAASTLRRSRLMVSGIVRVSG